MPESLKIIVSSTNPVKIKASETGLSTIPDFASSQLHVSGVKVASEVSDQPRSSAETLLGALNRVKNAQISVPDADYWVGLEGGVEEDSFGNMWSIVWGVLMDKEQHIGMAQPGRYRLPPEVADLIRSGMELGTADDIVFKRHNSKQGDGSVGILTHGALTRADYYIPAVTLSAIPFINPDLFPPEQLDVLLKRYKS